MQKQNTIRTLLFIAFFIIGASALVVSILCNDLIKAYHRKYQLTAEQEFAEKLKSLDIDYEILIEQIEKDPNYFKRITSAATGVEANEPNTAYPKASPELIEATKNILAEDRQLGVGEKIMPIWLERISEPKKRVVLFLAGSILVVICFISFGYKEPQQDQES